MRWCPNISLEGIRPARISASHVSFKILSCPEVYGLLQAFFMSFFILICLFPCHFPNHLFKNIKQQKTNQTKIKQTKQPNLLHPVSPSYFQREKCCNFSCVLQFQNKGKKLYFPIIKLLFSKVPFSSNSHLKGVMPLIFMHFSFMKHGSNPRWLPYLSFYMTGSGFLPAEQKYS